jgi:hypothetical protein
MNATKKQTKWAEFLKLFSEQNRFRPTRLGVFEGEPGEMKDYWLEDGLPLAGIDVDAHGEGFPTIEIMLGKSETADSRTMTHIIRGAQSAYIVLSPSGDDDGLEIKDAEGKTTFLRFENEPRK